MNLPNTVEYFAKKACIFISVKIQAPFSYASWRYSENCVWRHGLCIFRRGYFGCAFFMQFFLISGKIARLQHFGGMPISGFLIKIKNGGFHKVSI